MQHHEPKCHEGKKGAIFKVKVTARAHVIKIWLCSIFWIIDSLATKLGLIIHYYKPECLVKKLDNCFQALGYSQGSKCQCLSRWYLLNHVTFCYQTWSCDASPCARVHAKRLVCYFQGHGHSKGSYDQIWQFLLYLLNCWSFCYQTWFDGTLS